MSPPLQIMKSVDVYETCDLPEADQYMYSQSKDDINSVEILQLTPNEAFGRFKGSYIDGKSVDFSDKLRHTRNKGYSVVWTGEPVSNEKETLSKKYQRLNCEVRELMDDIAKSAAEGEDIPAEKLGQQLQLMHGQLVGLRLEEVVGQQLDTSHTTALLAELDTLKAGRDGKQKAEPSPASFSLYIDPGQEEQDAAELSSLAARLARLETALGTTPEAMAVLSTETGKKNLAGAVQVLSAKTALLDPRKLDHIEGRLGALQQKLSARHEGAGQGAGQERAGGRLQEMAATVERNKAGFASLAGLLARLESLQGLHQQAAQFSTDLTQLDCLGSQLLVQLNNDLSLLNNTKQMFDKNITNIEQNFSSLFQRIDKLSQAKQKKK